MTTRHVWAAGDQLNASDLNNSLAFGGSGADGALSITSGTTTLAMSSATTFIKNYTSISITSTGALAFSGPNSGGSRILLRSQGNVTITSTATRAIDIRGMGAAGGGQSSEIIDTGNHAGTTGTNGSGGGTGGPGGVQITSQSVFYARSSSNVNATRFLFIVPGTGGGGGGTGTSGGSVGGTGGAGAGALFIECGGSYNFGASSTIDASGSQGTVGVLSAGTCGGSGGSGSGGMILVLYGSLTADAGTYNVSGGAQLAGTTGAGGTTSGGGGGGGGTTEAAGDSGESSGVSLHGGYGGAGANGIALRIQNQFFA
jgi:hypothetical protein